MAEEPTTKGEKEEETKVAPTPIFGQGSTFAGTGFSGFSMNSGGFASSGTSEASGGTAAAANPEEECQAEFKPVVQLEKAEVTTGEESEEVKLEYKAKLYRYDFEKQEWKERGVGPCRILEDKKTKKTRVLMRRDKLHKICANFLIMPGTALQNHQGNDKTWVWSTPDFSEEEMKTELFTIRFGTVEKANEFKEAFEAGMKANEELGILDESKEAESKEEGEEKKKEDGVDELAKGLADVKVEGEEKKEEEESKE
ncbi:Ran-binding protein 1 [Chloropicon primus]|uniref:Ran-binding protein 1 n=1 Tax=Chloropicon primus TaxID=1764295 RepID=A0A5B8MMF9_9CHLO|nr:Ran-binding protein 1 [Chloropicon primus]|eukprot:QDZ21828.1 Ran-binding protein 1 [Chloropicon primus]